LKQALAVLLIVIVNEKCIKRHLKAERRVPDYSRASHRVRWVV